MFTKSMRYHAYFHFVHHRLNLQLDFQSTPNNFPLAIRGLYIYYIYTYINTQWVYEKLLLYYHIYLGDMIANLINIVECLVFIICQLDMIFSMEHCQFDLHVTG